MKLFLTIFAAILAAVAVVWGAMTWMKKTAKEQETARSVCLSGVELAKSTSRTLVITEGKIPEREMWARSHLDTPAEFARYHSMPWPSEGPAKSSVQSDFFFWYEEAIKTVRKAGADAASVAWADEMERKLGEARDRIEGRFRP